MLWQGECRATTLAASSQQIAKYRLHRQKCWYRRGLLTFRSRCPRRRSHRRRGTSERLIRSICRYRRSVGRKTFCLRAEILPFAQEVPECSGALSSTSQPGACRGGPVFPLMEASTLKSRDSPSWHRKNWLKTCKTARRLRCFLVEELPRTHRKLAYCAACKCQIKTGAGRIAPSQQDIKGEATEGAGAYDLVTPERAVTPLPQELQV